MATELEENILAIRKGLELNGLSLDMTLESIG
jgi:hypothetical protein